MPVPEGVEARLPVRPAEQAEGFFERTQGEAVQGTDQSAVDAQDERHRAAADSGDYQSGAEDSSLDKVGDCFEQDRRHPFAGPCNAGDHGPR